MNSVKPKLCTVLVSLCVRVCNFCVCNPPNTPPISFETFVAAILIIIHQFFFKSSVRLCVLFPRVDDKKEKKFQLKPIFRFISFG